MTAGGHILPRLDGAALDAVKIFAVLCMVVDHVNTVLFDNAFATMTLIGRATFPLFCYAVASAVLKMEEAGSAGDRLSRYAGRILLVAALTQPIYQATYSDVHANVLFTLAAGAVVAVHARTLPSWLLHLVLAFAAASHLFPTVIEFGLAGVFLPLSLVMLLRGERGGAVWALCFLLLVNQHGLLGRIPFTEAVWIGIPLAGLASIVPPLAAVRFASVIRGQARLMPKYALYAFYPAHLALLGLAKALFF